MIRRIINIDKEKCNGCGLCANACHEGAIAMVDGKAHLMREDFCDGFGDCLPACPTGAITFTEREAPAYNEQAVLASKAAKKAECASHAGHAHEAHSHEGHACPGSMMKMLHKQDNATQDCSCKDGPSQTVQSQLAQWPCQIKLVPTSAPFFQDAHLLIAADCTAYAFASMHNTFMKGRTTIIGCPKLDSVDYSEKLSQILYLNNIRDITVVRMEVPCCGGLEMATVRAIEASGKNIPLKVYTITLNGQIKN